jgi:hypothetical protein
MGSCATCGGDIPDGTTFCGIHAFDPGKSSKSFPDSIWKVPNLEPTGGGGGGEDLPTGSGGGGWGNIEPTSEPPEGGRRGGYGGGGFGGGDDPI